MRRRTSQWWIHALAVLLFAAASAVHIRAAAYYVDPAVGSDTWNGQYETAHGGTAGPWRHFPGTLGVTGSGWVLIRPGDSVVVKGGAVLPDSIQIDSTWYANGASGNLIKLLSGHLSGWGSQRAAVDGGASPSGAGIWGKGFHILARSYIHIEGFEIRNMKNETNSAGVFIDGDTSSWCEIVDNVIHEIYGAPGPSGYGIEVTGGLAAAYMLIDGNVIYHTEEKAIELYNQGKCTIRRNFISQTNDHGVVISSSGNTIYDNLITQAGYHWMSYESPFRPSFGLKFDSDPTVFADNNTMYDNVLFDCSSGIGILDGNNNRICFNTVYHSGFQGGEAGGYEGAAFAIEDDGTAGSHIPSGNVVQDNIFYFGNLINSAAQTVAFNAKIGPDNAITKNLIFCDSAHLSTLVYFSDTGGPRWNTVSWFEGADGFSSIGSGNSASRNVVLDPLLAGGTGAAIMSSLPTGFTSSWSPNTGSFGLSSLTPQSVKEGDPLAAPFDTDIVGRTRRTYSLGAYEQTEIAPLPPTPPSGLRIRH
jgi:parallel beta-helix repeat protein